MTFYPHFLFHPYDVDGDQLYVFQVKTEDANATDFQELISTFETMVESMDFVRYP